MTSPTDSKAKPRKKSLMRSFRKAVLGLLLTATLGYGALLASYTGKGEKLTKGETELVEGIFGDEVNTSKIRKHFKNNAHITHVLPSKTGTVLPPHSHIDFFGPSSRSDDFSCDSTGATGLFIHEVTHVWQNQNMAWPLDKLYKCRRYDYTLKPASTFRDFGIEQQASIIEDYVEAWIHKDSRARKGEVMTHKDSLLLKIVETRFPTAKKTRLSL